MFVRFGILLYLCTNKNEIGMKRLLLTLLVVMVTAGVNAERVSKQEALRKAQQFMPGKKFGEARGFARSVSSSEGEPFYVFNAEGNKGFVIVSGDDRTTEIIGYSKTGKLDINQLPENLKGWLDGYVRQIEALGTSAKSAKKAKARGADSWKAISPLIQTQWNQHYPYNMMCPDGNGKDWRDDGFNPQKLCVTGCVATAMAQIMYYWGYPKKCPALDGYKTRTRKWNIKALPEADFDWNSMKLSYNGNETDVSAAAVATLFRYCGQAVNMDYNLEGSSAGVSAGVMAEVFGYSKNIRDLYRDPYTTSQWEEMVYAELVAGRPVLYSGQSEDGGHQFVVDGYDGNGLFHMNWGWGGMSDDYFVLSLADPDSQGAGGSATNGAFQFGQSALFGVKPGNDAEVMMPLIESQIEIMDNEYARAGVEDDFTAVHFKGTFYAHYNAPSTEVLNVTVGWALCQNGKIKEVVSDDAYTISAGMTYPGRNTNSEVSFGAGLALGKYEICQVYRYSDDEAWRLCAPCYDTYFYVAEVTETTLTVRQPVSSFKVNTITTSENPSTGSPLDVKLNVTNDGETFEQVINLWVQKEGESTWTSVAKATRKIDSGKTEDVVMSYVPKMTGTYTLKVTNGKSEDALKTATVTVYASISVTVGNLKFVCHSGTKKAILVGHTYGANGNAVEVNIPSTIDDGQYTVTEIADRAFQYFGRITAVTIPSTVETIGDEAFINCYRLSEIVIPEGVKYVGESAFAFCYWLKAVELPATLQSLGENVFYECPLSTVVAAMQNPIGIARNVFLTTEEVDGETVEVFTSADLYVPIGQKAAYSAAEVWKEFPVIYQGKLKDITLEDGITYTYITGEDFAIVKSGDQTALQDKDIVIPSTITAEGKTYNVKKIADNAFFNVQMKSLTIQQGVEEIGACAFWNDYRIKEIIIPASVKRIGASAFQYCFALRSVELPASLTSIGDYAFGTTNEYGTSNRLTSVVSYISIPFDIADNVFGIEDGDNMTPPTATLTVPYGTTSKYQDCTGWQKFATITEMENQDAKPGDANGDGVVNAADVDAVVNYIITGDMTGFVFDNANLNGDDKVDAADLVLLINMIK